jgi:hypothetical protein
MPSVTNKYSVILAALFALLGAGTAARAQTANSPTQDASPQQQPGGGGGGGGGARGGRGGGPAPGVYKSAITPHWFDGHAKFWRRNALRGGASEFILVDAEKGLRQPAFDHLKLAASLSTAADKDFDLLVVPGAGHGAASPVNRAYTGRRTEEFLVRNLISPPAKT